jgi:hypothetical protein
MSTLTKAIDEAMYLAIIHGATRPLAIPLAEGTAAHANGKGFHENPYAFFSCEAISWRIGWNNAALTQR